MGKLSYEFVSITYEINIWPLAKQYTMMNGYLYAFNSWINRYK